MELYSIKNCAVVYTLICSILACAITLKAAPCWEAKVRGAAFIPTNSLFREIYGSAAGNFDAEIAMNIGDCLQVWANFDYTGIDGNSLNFCNPTSINIFSGSFGLKAPFDTNDWSCVYLGFGPAIGGIQIKDNSQFSGCSNNTKAFVGFVAKFGVDFFFANCWFVDFFADYTYQKVSFQKLVDASGVRIGAGIGCTF